MRKYLILIKYRLSLTVALSAAVGYFLYQPQPDISLLWVFLGVFLMAGGSAALNQYQERAWDKLMKRTINRPIPSGEITVKNALGVSIILMLSGSITLSLNGLLPSILGLSNIIFYNVLYTGLKRKSIFAILPGGIVGAIPPLIGWTSAGGSLFHPNILFLATVIFLWQIPHFWLLLIRYGEEYENAGFESITKYLDKKQISRLVFFWIIMSSIFIASYPIFGIELKLILAVVIIVLNITAISFFYYILFRSRSSNNTRLAFIVTNIFLSLILLIFILNAFLA